jgi:epoxyqueuosine reductase
MCGACAAACPGGAIGEERAVYAERCLRHFAPMKREIPEAIRALLGLRLIGCDDCQSVCPMNRSIAPAEPPGELLRATRLSGRRDWGGGQGGADLGALGRLIGENEARPVRITAAAALHAGNTGDAAYLPALGRLAKHPDDRVREMAAWAAARIRNGAQTR